MTGVVESSGDCACCRTVLLVAETDTHHTPKCDECGYGVNVVVPRGTSVLCPSCAFKAGWGAEPCENQGDGT